MMLALNVLTADKVRSSKYNNHRENKVTKAKRGEKEGGGIDQGRGQSSLLESDQYARMRTDVPSKFCLAFFVHDLID